MSTLVSMQTIRKDYDLTMLFSQSLSSLFLIHLIYCIVFNLLFAMFYKTVKCHNRKLLNKYAQSVHLDHKPEKNSL